MITNEKVEEAVTWLADTGRSAASSRAEREYLEAYTKVLKATIMRENSTESLGAQESIAYSDKRYLKHIEELKKAIFMDEGIKWKRAASEVLIEVWRSEQANERALSKI